MFLANLVSNTAPEKSRHPEQLTSQLDQVISYYNIAGVHEYDWRKFGPEMQQAEWHYFSFDPALKAQKDKKGRIGDMYREVKLPSGMDQWSAADFDALKAGWKTGKAPFGQKVGEKEALIEGCKVSYCGCNITPGTLWEKEVILMRQTFEVPEFKQGHRYRIVVGGAGHAWSGEGFALYVDGQLVCEATGGYYKGGGQPRGAYIFESLKPTFEDGKATFAVKAFLRQTGHRGKMAPPRGHISVWLEEAKLPQPVLEMPQEEEEKSKK